MPITRSRSAALAAALVNGGRRLRSSVRAVKPAHTAVKPTIRKRRVAVSKRAHSTPQVTQVIPDEVISSNAGDTVVIAGPSDETQETRDTASLILQEQTDAVTVDRLLSPLPQNVAGSHFGEGTPVTGTPNEALILQPTSPAILVDTPGKDIGFKNTHPDVSAALDKVLIDVEGTLGRLSPGASYSVQISKRSARDPSGRVVAAARRMHKLNTRARTSASRSVSHDAHIEDNRNNPEEGLEITEMVSDTRRGLVAMGISSNKLDTGKELLYMPEDGLPQHQSYQSPPAATSSQNRVNVEVDSFSQSAVVATIPHNNETAVAQQNNQGTISPENHEEIMPHYEAFCAWWRVYGGGAAGRQPIENTPNLVRAAEGGPPARESTTKVHNEVQRQPQRVLYTFDTWSPSLRQQNYGQLALQTSPIPTIRRTPHTRAKLTLEELMRGPEDTPPAPVSPTLSDRILWAETTMQSVSSMMSSAALEVEDEDDNTVIDATRQEEPGLQELYNDNTAVDATIQEQLGLQELFDNNTIVDATIQEEPGLPELYNANTAEQELESTAPYSDPPEWPFI